MLTELWADVRYRLRALFRRDDLERELDQELRFHVEQASAQYRAQGLAAGEARRQALIDFGSVENAKEESREGRGITYFEGALVDVRHALRGLRRSPGFTLTAVVTLGLGIGANATMFGIVDRLLFRPPAFIAHPDRVHRVYFFETDDGARYADANTSYRRYLDLRRWTQGFDALALAMDVRLPVGRDLQDRERSVLGVTSSYWNLFAMTPVVGRFFSEEEDAAPIGTPVAVLGYAYWRSHFGGSVDVVGRPLEIGRRTYTVIGVAPDGFTGMSLSPPAAIIPLVSTLYELGRDPKRLDDYGWGWPEIFVRRRPGVSLEQANTDLTAATRLSYTQEHLEDANAGSVESLQPAAEAAPVQEDRAPGEANIPGAGTAQVALWLGGVALVVLLIACANVGNLLLGRAFGRRREMAVRLALGVSRRRLLSQLLTESLVLALLGTVAGLGAAQWGGGILRATLLQNVPRSDLISDPRILVFAIAAAVVSGLLAGMAPYFFARNTEVADALKAGARITYRRSHTRVALLLIQGALSVVLLIGAGLFVRSFHRVQGLRLGYDPDRLLYVQPIMLGVGKADEDRTDDRLNTLAPGIPGIETSTRAAAVPLASLWGFDVFVPGLDTAYIHRLGAIRAQGGTPSYFATMGTRILRGRGFTTEDGVTAPWVAVVSASLANALWPGKEALGQCFRIRTPDAPCRTVVGVAEDVVFHDFRGGPALAYYLPIGQWGRQTQSLFLRTRGPAARYVEPVRRALQAAMPGATYVTVVPFTALVQDRTRSWVLGATMFTIFGALALLVAAIGLYGVVAYAAVQRSRELSIRMALGAGRAAVFRLVVGSGLRQALGAVAAGLMIALLGVRWIQPLLFRTAPRDPLVFGGVAALLLTVSAVASAVPALRAARRDPVVALQED